MINCIIKSDIKYFEDKEVTAIYSRAGKYLGHYFEDKYYIDGKCIGVIESNGLYNATGKKLIASLGESKSGCMFHISNFNYAFRYAYENEPSVLNGCFRIDEILAILEEELS